MKKNKGYTLAELLVIIAIIGILISLTSYTITRVINASRNNIKEQELNSLMDAGKSYINTVIDGEDTYSFTSGNYSGYDFILYLVNNCLSESTKKCDKSTDVNTGEITVSLEVPMASLKEYIDEDKYNVGFCGMHSSIIINKNSNGYYVIDGVDIKKDATTSAKKCVKS